MGVAAGNVWPGFARTAQSGCEAHGICFDDSCGHSDFLSAAAEFRRAAVRAGCGEGSTRRIWAESIAAVSGDGDSPADAVPRLCRLQRAVCFRAGRADDAVSGREMDSHYAPLDDGDVALSDVRDFSRRALGVFGTWMGRLLGMGPGGECVADAVADRHGVSALSDDAGKARHDEELECVAH